MCVEILQKFNEKNLYCKKIMCGSQNFISKHPCLLISFLWTFCSIFRKDILSFKWRIIVIAIIRDERGIPKLYKFPPFMCLPPKLLQENLQLVLSCPVSNEFFKCQVHRFLTLFIYVQVKLYMLLQWTLQQLPLSLCPSASSSLILPLITSLSLPHIVTISICLFMITILKTTVCQTLLQGLNTCCII